MDKKGFELFIDGDKYRWEQDTITGAQLRVLGAIPEGVEIFLQVPGKPDEPITDTTSVNLEEHHGPARFSTQSPGSQAGDPDAPSLRV
ncbi:MAG TPA: multiubiquitin domain-containing protein [Edaphobacter sp.]|uniref:multiubiquitin domain-containing protein n=1 Tax=Edaphobacter sp. TaxID=1934404 RepID=UPI002C70BB31|nr:multiubiquitin domain-containing protein [Edaphobacter sp.]HUZ95337.1 multiubiquitin domain-containing protein [Edaphobacter sp.]